MHDDALEPTARFGAPLTPRLPNGVFVVVTGLPASGKTTLATELASRLGLPLIQKDAIKEVLGECFPAASDEDSARLGAAGMEVLWSIAAGCPSAVLETYWYPESAVPRFAHLARLCIEVHCTAPKEVCIERFLARVPHRHSSHREHFSPMEEVRGAIALWPDPSPLGIGPVIAVDTTTPVELPSLCDAIIEAVSLRLTHPRPAVTR